MKLVMVEMHYDDGSIMSLRGKDAQLWDEQNMRNLTWLLAHNFFVPEVFNWKREESIAVKTVEEIWKKVSEGGKDDN